MILAKLIENEEIADFQFRNKKSFFEIIEDPLLPLARKFMKTKTMVMYAVILGLFVSFAILFFRFLYFRTLEETT